VKHLPHPTLLAIAAVADIAANQHEGPVTSKALAARLKE